MDGDGVTRYPLDFDAIAKGDIIPAAVVEQTVQARRGTDSYRLGALALRDRVIRECADRGKYFTAVLTRDQIRILTDDEAAEYNARTFNQGVRKSKRSLRRLLQVDASVLADGQRREHERNVLVFGKMLQAATSERKRLEAKPHQRMTPGLPQKADE